MFRAPLCPSSGAQEYYTGGCCLWYFVLWFSSSWSGVELRVMCPVCRMLQHPANRTHNHQLHTRPATWKTTAQNTTRSNHCIILLSSWWWAWWCPKHVEQAIRSAIKTSVASSWHFISTYFHLVSLLAKQNGGSKCLLNLTKSEEIYLSITLRCSLFHLTLLFITFKGQVKCLKHLKRFSCIISLSTPSRLVLNWRQSSTFLTSAIHAG